MSALAGPFAQEQSQFINSIHLPTGAAHPILMARLLRPRSVDDFEIAIICALTIERDVVEALLDEE